MGREGCQECEKGWQKAIVAFQIISFLLSSASIIVTRFINNRGTIASSISEELIQNFKSSYFVNFGSYSFQDNNIYLDQLLDETNDISINFDEWKGTLKGCKKSNKTTIYKDGDECDKEIPKIYPKSIDKYKGIMLRKNDEYETKSYIELLKNGYIVENDKDCPDEKKNCGIIDTLENKLCIDTSEDCPINYIFVSDKDPTTVIPNLKKIQGNNANLYYTNNPVDDKTTKRYIANSFKIIDEKTCIFPNLIYTTFELNDFFVLEASKNDYSRDCDLNNDYTQKYAIDDNVNHRYIILDNIDNYELYNENKIIEAISQAGLDEEGYNTQKYKNHKLTLIYTIHRGFNLSCVGEEQYEINNLNAINTKANKMKKFKNYNWFLLIGMVTSLGDLVNVSGTFSEQFIKNFISLIDSGIFMIYGFHAISWDDHYEKKTKCFDEYTNHLYNSMISKVRNSGKLIFAVLILDTFLCIFNIITFGLRICNKKD